MFQPSKLSQLPIDYVPLLNTANRNINVDLLIPGNNYSQVDSNYNTGERDEVAPLLAHSGVKGENRINYELSAESLDSANRIEFGIDLDAPSRNDVYHYLFQIAYSTNFAQAHIQPFVCVLQGVPNRSLVNGSWTTRRNVTDRYHFLAGQGWSDRGNVGVHCHVIVSDEKTVHDLNDGALIFGASVSTEVSRALFGVVSLSLFRWSEDVRSFDPNLG